MKQAAVAEFIGTAFLLATIVGSGIMGARLANGNAAIALLANSLATGAILVVLILTFGPISGAHFNPVVTLAMAIQNGMRRIEVIRYLLAQGLGALVGVASANVMFGLPPILFSQHSRTGGAQMFSEFVATFGLLMVILVCSKSRPAAIAYVVAAYITAAYWFTSSTSFANPIVTLGRALTDTFSGIRPVDAPLFILAQVAGGVAAFGVFQTMAKSRKQRVLILCTGNSARSQMAEGLLRHDAGDRFEVASAGTHPSRVRPEAIEAMKEIGIDISSHRSKSVDEFAKQEFDYVLTVCDQAKESCPIYAGHGHRLHHSFEDPAAVQGSGEEKLNAFRGIRDQIRSYLRSFPRG